MNEDLDVLIKLATIYAFRKDAETATSYMNNAIEFASKQDDLMPLIAVATAAGRIEQLLLNNDQSQEAYEQALAFVEDGIEDYHLMNAAVLMNLFLGLLEVKGYDQQLVVKLLQLVPKAADTPAAWQSFSRTIPFVEEFILNSLENMTSEVKHDLLAPFFKFIALRVDCSLEVERLKRIVTV